MFRIIIPTIVILGAIASFFAYTSPQYKAIKSIKLEIASYDSALKDSTKLVTARKSLRDKYNSIPIESQEKLEKILPDNIDNIRFILELQKISKESSGISLKNIKFNAPSNTPVAPGQVAQVSTSTVALQNKPYNQAEMEFTAVGSYSNFLNFLQNLEKSLRIIDIESISFSSTESSGFSASTAPTDVYNFNFKVKTYWLKN